MNYESLVQLFMEIYVRGQVFVRSSRAQSARSTIYNLNLVILESHGWTGFDEDGGWWGESCAGCWHHVNQCFCSKYGGWTFEFLANGGTIEQLTEKVFEPSAFRELRIVCWFAGHNSGVSCMGCIGFWTTCDRDSVTNHYSSSFVYSVPLARGSWCDSQISSWISGD